MTTAEVRRLVYDLRPPQLDELGLIGALREQAGRFSGELEVSVAAPDALPPLPAAVEVAAYRIVTEALTNVARHAEASTCRVVLALDGSLDISVIDDGRGIAADARHGVGLGSMRERADWRDLRDPARRAPGYAGPGPATRLGSAGRAPARAQPRATGRPQPRPRSVRTRPECTRPASGPAR